MVYLHFFQTIIIQFSFQMVANESRPLYKTLISPLLFLLFFIFFLPFTILPQVPDLPENIDPEILRQASPTDLQRYLKDKNQGQINPGEDVHRSRSTPNVKNSNKTVHDSLRIDSIDNRMNIGVYGSSLFKNTSILELSELSTPPLDYPIGVGDHIVVSLWGGADVEIDYIVARDGSIFPQGLGKITVQGLTFENARAIISDRFRRVTPPGTNIAVTMGQPRTIVVNVSGEVNNPGPVVVSAFTNALNVIALAGGLTEYGDLRTIIIKRNGRVIDSLDVYKYLTRGDFGRHLYMENNDFVIVNIYSKKVLASGQFKRPMYYLLKKDEGFRDLLTYTGGLTPDAYASGGIIIRNVEEKQVIKNVNFNAIGSKNGDSVTDEELFNGDVIVVNPINAGLKNKVIVRGEVNYPNVYEYREGDRLFDLINRAGGITPNAYLQRAYVYKGAGDSTIISSQKIDVNLSDLNKNNDSRFNVLITPNDVIEVFNRNQFFDRQFVTIEGEVRSPGTLPKYGGMTLKDLIYLSNGLKPSAEFGRIEISSIVDIDSAQQGLRPTQTVVRSYTIRSNLELDSVTEKVLIKPYDQVFVRKNPIFELQQNVTIQGLVKYEGTYSRLHKNETVSSFIARAGGLKENANLAGAILYRNKNTGIRDNPYLSKETKYIRDSTGEVVDSVVFNPSEPVSIDLYKALQFKNSKYDLVLQEGDIIFIPEINPIVSVKGAVQSPLKVYFDKEHRRLTYYIDKAGGFGIRPWRKRVYVTHANGKSERTRNFGFFHFYPRVEAGTIIVVPIKPESKAITDFASQILVSVVPILAAIIFANVINN
jgi:protein involved in polysaccharide export with SLBB domain